MKTLKPLRFSLPTLRRKRAVGEAAPALSAFQRLALETPGVPPNGLAYAVYDDMRADSMIQTCLTVKTLGVLAAPWELRAENDEARRRAAFVAETFERMEGSPLTVLANAMDAMAKGWSIQELVWEARDGRLWLRIVKPKDPSLFGLELDAFGAPNGINMQIPGEAPVPLPLEKFAIYAHRVGYATPKGRSDLDAAYPHWSAKKRLIAAWKLHLERFASPTVLGKFQRGLPASEQTALLGSLRDLHQNTAIVFPSEIEVETLGGGKDSANAFLDAIEFHNREIARAILGQTLTTDEGRRVGSLALGKVHLQVLMLQLRSLRRDLADAFMTEQIVRPIVEWNFGPGPIPRFAFIEGGPDAFAEVAAATA